MEQWYSDWAWAETARIRRESSKRRHRKSNRLWRKIARDFGFLLSAAVPIAFVAAAVWIVASEL